MKPSCVHFVAIHSALFLSGVVQAQTNNLINKPGSRTPTQVINGSAQFVGPYDQTEKLRLVFGLKPPKADEEKRFLEALYTPGTPEYHKFLTAEEWNARFSPSAADEQAVVDWAHSQGLTITKRYPNRLIVDAEAPVAQIQRAFGVNINRYQLSGAAVFSNDRDPVIPPHLSGVIQSVAGLNNIQVVHSHLRTARQITQPDYVEGPSAALVAEYHANGDRGKLAAAMAERKGRVVPFITPEGGYEPVDLISSNAYDLFALSNLGHCCNPTGNPGGSPPETSIAIASAGSVNTKDFDGFRAQYPFLAFNVTVIHVNGTSTAFDLEGTLDVEWATVMGNSFDTPADTAHVYIYEGSNNLFSTFTDIYNQMLSDGHARVMSTSWGAAEVVDSPPDLMTTQDNIFAAMAGQGWTLVAASGDHGSVTDCGFPFPTVDFPASSPNVIAAGGTALRLNSDSSYNSETAWTGAVTAGSCAANDGGGGGGFSAVFGVPFYQAFLGNGVRTVPDISLNASFFQTIFEGGAVDFAAGTSIVAPELAGFFAQENAYLLFLQTEGVPCFGNQACAPIGNANFYIYAEQQHAPYAPHYPFYDITVGCNSNDVTINNPSSFYCATGGYDLATGLGSINMLQLAWAINYNAAGDFGPPEVKFFGPATNKWYNTDQTISVSVVDTTLSPRPPTGVAGFSLAWDKDPAPESFVRLTPGSGDAFYTGPQFPNQNRGIFILSQAGQGCHTGNAKAWDNTGTSSGLLSYGPICFDTVAPATTATLSGTKSGGVFTSSVKLTLTAKDVSSGVALTSYSLDGNAFVTYTGPVTFSVPSGTHTLRYFSKDVAGNTEATHTQTFVVKLPTTVTTVTPSLNPSTFGLNVTLTAKVTPSSGGIPTGLVNFKDGSTVLGAVALSNGQAAFATKALHAGSHAITAVYLGSANDSASTSAALTETINKAATKTTLASSVNPSTHGSPVTFTATVVPSSGTVVGGGTVTFKGGTTTLGTVAVNTSTHAATFTTSALPVGTTSITAVYGGSADLNGSTSAALSQAVK
jgi:hypothetical protein